MTNATLERPTKKRFAAPFGSRAAKAGDPFADAPAKGAAADGAVADGSVAAETVGGVAQAVSYAPRVQERAARRVEDGAQLAAPAGKQRTRRPKWACAD